MMAQHQLKGKKSKCIMKEHWKTGPNSIQVTIEDNLLISTSESVKSSSVGIRSELIWKSGPKLKFFVHPKPHMEAEL